MSTPGWKVEVKRISMIDDATSRLEARFEENNSTEQNILRLWG